jgi:glycosyltransferase involved in cell wall biosynthesis
MAGLPRVAHVLPWPTVGGVELGALRLARSLREQSVFSLALVQQNAAPVDALFRSDDFATLTYDAAEPSFRHGRGYLAASRDIARELRRHSIDIVHCADLLAAYHAGLAARLAGCSLVCHIRCGYPQITARDRLFLKAVQHWIFVSQGTWDEFALPVSAKRGSVVYDAAEPPPAAPHSTGWAARLREFGVPEEARIIGMVARLAPIKDYDTLARAAQIVVRQEPRAHFVIVGDYSGAATYRKHYVEVRELIARLGIERHFSFTGFQDDVRSIMQSFEVSLLATHSEGLPLVLLEAMHLGKPVVATAVGGVPELVVHGETGLLHAHRDSDQLASSILYLLADPIAAGRLSHGATARIKTHFSRTAFANGILNVYSRLGRWRMPARVGFESAPHHA